jgi:hypothetical protein
MRRESPPLLPRRRGRCINMTILSPIGGPASKASEPYVTSKAPIGARSDSPGRNGAKARVVESRGKDRRAQSRHSAIPPFRHWGGCKATGRMQSYGADLRRGRDNSVQRRVPPIKPKAGRNSCVRLILHPSKWTAQPSAERTRWRKESRPFRPLPDFVAASNPGLRCAPTPGSRIPPALGLRRARLPIALNRPRPGRSSGLSNTRPLVEYGRNPGISRQNIL